MRSTREAIPVRSFSCSTRRNTTLLEAKRPRSALARGRRSGDSQALMTTHGAKSQGELAGYALARRAFASLGGRAIK